MERTFIGIDPGSESGGIAVISGDTLVVSKMPESYQDLYDLLASYAEEFGSENITAVLEDVGYGIPNQSSRATATFARHNGHLQMALYALGLRTIMVKPQKWEKEYSGSIGGSSGLSKSEWKGKLKDEARRLFPKVKVTNWNADALLISEYGKRKQL